MSAAAHDWLLVAPWYRWRRQRSRPARRGATPPGDPEVRASATLVDAHRRRSTPTARRRSLITGEDGRRRARHDASCFLPTHKRFYVVVCEAALRPAGVPEARRDQVCEAGFVIRRRQLPLPDDAHRDAHAAAAAHRHRSARAAAPPSGLRDGIVRGGAGGDRRGGGASRPRGPGPARGAAPSSRSSFDEVGGRKLAVEGLGDAGPTASARGPARRRAPRAARSFPLYPLVPTRRPDHAAHGRTIYFGVLPTGARTPTPPARRASTTATLYELRCFVRRHAAARAARQQRLPRRADLERAERAVPARGADRPRRYEQPAGDGAAAGPRRAARAGREPAVRRRRRPEHRRARSLALDVGGRHDDERGPLGGPEICFFAIPLITIVATFLLNLFLPIVVFAVRALVRCSRCASASRRRARRRHRPSRPAAASGGVDVNRRHRRFGATLDAAIRAT